MYTNIIFKHNAWYIISYPVHSVSYVGIYVEIIVHFSNKVLFLPYANSSILTMCYLSKLLYSAFHGLSFGTNVTSIADISPYYIIV